MVRGYTCPNCGRSTLFPIYNHRGDMYTCSSCNKRFEMAVFRWKEIKDGVE